MAALDALLVHPQVTCVHGQVVTCCARADDDHAALFADEYGGREGCLAGVFEYHVDVVAFAGDVPDGFAELADLAEPFFVFGGVNRGHLAPAVEVFAVDDAFCTEAENEFAFVFIRDHADGVRACGVDQLNSEGSQAAGCAPYQYVLAGLQGVRAVAEQHAIGCGEG